MKVSGPIPSAPQKPALTDSKADSRSIKGKSLEDIFSPSSTSSQRGSGVKSEEIGSSARLSLSPRAQELKRVKALATPDLESVDEEKVARLQKLIDEGHYKVDAEAVADRLVDEHLMD